MPSTAPILAALLLLVVHLHLVIASRSTYDILAIASD
jgi:hypothetical protein